VVIKINWKLHFSVHGHFPVKKLVSAELAADAVATAVAVEDAC
jgi:hypothetical protein